MSRRVGVPAMDQTVSFRPGRITRVIREALRCRDGATAIEFGMLAAPFLFLMYAILEIAMMFWTTQVLETATANAARQIYTGQFQNDPSNNVAGQTAADLATNFKTAVCANVTALFDCPTLLKVDIRNVTDFSSAAVPAMIVGGVFNSAAFTYQAIQPGNIALITAAFEYSTYTKMFVSTPGLTDGNRIIVSTAIFQAEPYAKP